MRLAESPCPSCGSVLPLYWWDLVLTTSGRPGVPCGNCGQTASLAAGRAILALLAGGAAALVGLALLQGLFGRIGWLGVFPTIFGLAVVQPLVGSRIARMVRVPPRRG